MERHRPDSIGVHTIVAAQLTILSSDDAAVAAKAKVDGHGLERHAPRTKGTARVFQARLADLAIWHEPQTEVVPGYLQLDGFPAQRHIAYHGLGVPLK